LVPPLRSAQRALRRGRFLGVCLPFAEYSKGENTRSPVPKLLLADMLTPDRIKIPLVSEDKESLIEELTALLASAAGVPEETERIRSAVLDRESVLSTGIGDGVAIPHCKCDSVDELVLVAGTTRRPVDFDALDARPVRIALMLVAPESAAGLHVKLLSRVGRLLREEALRDRLAASRTPEDFIRAIRDAESR